MLPVRRSRQMNALNQFGDAWDTFDTMLDRMLRGWGFSSLPGVPSANFIPQVDVVDTATHKEVYLEVPGIKKEDITVELIDGNLVIRGEKKCEYKDAEVSERCYGRFERSWPLPEGIKEDSIEAEYKDGVLVLRLAKEEAKEKKKVSISVK